MNENPTPQMRVTDKRRAVIKAREERAQRESPSQRKKRKRNEARARAKGES